MTYGTVAPVTSGVIVMNLARLSGEKNITCDVAVIASVAMVIEPSVIFVANNFDPDIACCDIVSFIITDVARNVAKIVHDPISVQPSG